MINYPKVGLFAVKPITILTNIGKADDCRRKTCPLIDPNNDDP
jgi:hypothetical protein